MRQPLDIAYQPTKSARALVIVFVAPGTLFIGYLGFALLHLTPIWGVTAIFVAILLCVWTIFITTKRVALSKQELTRTWKWGSYTIPIGEITKLEWGRLGGQLNLVVRAGKRWVMLSSLSFREQELREIANTILAVRGLEGRQPWPPGAAYVDVSEMAKRYGVAECRNQMSVSVAGSQDVKSSMS